MVRITTEVNLQAPQQRLKDLNPVHSHFVGIDSDGCVFDTMEVKQMECFCPALISHFELQSIAEYVKETWAFVTLYSKNRGANRFIAMLETIELLKKRPEVAALVGILPDLTPVTDWVKSETRLGNPALKAHALKVNDPVINKVLEWSLESNDMMIRSARDVSPFPNVKTSLERVQGKADTVVISQCAGKVLENEWSIYGLDTLIHMIAGQECGNKTEQLAVAAVGKYAEDNILMIGDAPGDKKAAEDNGVLFYPILPGREGASWQRFYKEGLDRFLEGKYAGDYQKTLIEEYNEQLADTPPWEK